MGERLLRWGVDAVIAVGMAVLGVVVWTRASGESSGARAFAAEAAMRQQMGQLEVRLDEVEARLLSGARGGVENEVGHVWLLKSGASKRRKKRGKKGKQCA